MDCRAFYEGMAREHGLPSFDEVNTEFHIEDIDDRFLFHILERVVEKIEKYRKFLEDYIQPDGSSYAVLMEIKTLTEKNKDTIQMLYRELMLIERNYLLVDLEDNEVLFLKNTLQKWKALKADIRSIVQSAIDSWDEESTHSEEIRYVG